MFKRISKQEALNRPTPNTLPQTHTKMSEWGECVIEWKFEVSNTFKLNKPGLKRFWTRKKGKLLMKNFGPHQNIKLPPKIKTQTFKKLGHMEHVFWPLDLTFWLLSFEELLRFSKDFDKLELRNILQIWPEKIGKKCFLLRFINLDF